MYACNALKLYLTLFTEHAHHGASYWRSIMYACNAPKLYLTLFTEHAMATPYWRSIMYACNALKLYLTLFTEHTMVTPIGLAFWGRAFLPCGSGHQI